MRSITIRPKLRIPGGISRVFAIVAVLAMLMVVLPTAVSAQGGTVSGDKTLNETDITCNGSVNVTLSLDAQTGIAGDPVDIVLVLDRSGSMAGTPLANLKTAANTFVDIIDEATDGTLDGTISSGSQVAVVRFDDTAETLQGLTTNAGALKTAINSLTAGDTTNHTAAFQQASTVLGGGSPGDVVIIMTDGQSVPSSADGIAAAAALRTNGVEIYAIGLGSVNVSQLNNWATDPDSEHVFVTPDSDDLQSIFEAIGAAIVVPAATGVEVVDTVDSHFSISNVVASKGTFVVAGNVITWNIDKLGTETVTLTYTATHNNTQPGGVEQVNDSVTYSDAEGHVVNFPNPSVNVHGCAANLELTPAAGENNVGEDHTVTATVTDDFGDPVEGVVVDFSVAGGTSNPTPANGSDTTDANGEATFTYSNSEASQDTITATASTQANVSIALMDTAEKTWLPIFVPGDEGCSPGYWKNHLARWAPTGYTPGQTLESVFDVPDSLGLDNTTLQQALNFGGGPGAKGGAQILLRAGVAALLNASHPDVAYTMSASDVIDAVNAALATNNRGTMLALAGELDADNNLGCPIDAHGRVIR